MYRHWDSSSPSREDCYPQPYRQRQRCFSAHSAHVRRSSPSKSGESLRISSGIKAKCCKVLVEQPQEAIRLAGSAKELVA